MQVIASIFSSEPGYLETYCNTDEGLQSFVLGHPLLQSKDILVGFPGICVDAPNLLL